MNTLTILSGADVGGSFYLLEFNGLRFLFDCGTKPNCAYSEHVEIPDPETIDGIFISHAHIDHMGAIAYVAAECVNAKLYATAMTAELIRHQLSATIADYIGANTEELRYHNKLLCRLVLNRVETVEYEKQYRCTGLNGKECQFAFFHAGHMPGAAMIYMKIDRFRFLYTGDFSTRETPLTGAYDIPKIPVDTLLLCGLHANDRDFELRTNNISDSLKSRFRQAFHFKPKVIVKAAQLTKGLEMISVIVNLIREKELPECPVYVSDTMWRLAQSFERKSELFRLPACVKRLSDRPEETDELDNEVIICDSPEIKKRFPGYEEISTDFSLHTDYQGLIDFINKINAPDVYLVHVANLSGVPRLSTEDRINNSVDIHYTENGESYKLRERR